MYTGEIQRVAGEETVSYLLNIVNGKLDYLNRLPKNVLLKLILMLDLESVSHLSMTCSLFREVSSTDFTQTNKI